MTGWAVFLALLLSFVFSGSGLDLGRRLSRGRNGAGQDVKLSAPDFSSVIDYAESEVLEENEEEEELREELWHSFVQRVVPAVRTPYAFYHESPCVVALNRSPVSCPLLI